MSYQSTTPLYEFIAVNHAGTEIAELPNPRNRGYSRFLSAPGTANFKLSQDDLFATDTYIQPGVIHLRIKRDGTTVWEGLIDGISESSLDVNLLASSYEKVLEKYITSSPLNYQAKKIGTEIVKPIWDNAQAETNSFFSAFTDGTFEDPLDGGVARTINIRFDYEPLLSVFQKMADIGKA